MTSQDALKHSREMVTELKQSQIYRDYEQAFRDTTLCRLRHQIDQRGQVDRTRIRQRKLKIDNGRNPLAIP